MGGEISTPVYFEFSQRYLLREQLFTSLEWLNGTGSIGYGVYVIWRHIAPRSFWKDPIADRSLALRDISLR